MNTLAVLAALCAMAIFIMGNMVYARNTKGLSNRIFFYLCISVAYWGFAEYNYLQALTPANLNVALRLLIFRVFTPVLALHFVLVFAEKEQLFRKKRMGLALYGPAVLFILLDIPTGCITGTLNFPSARTVIEGVPFPSTLAVAAFLIWSILISVLIIAVSLRYYFSLAEPQQRRGARYVMVAFSFSVICSYTLELLRPRLGAHFPSVTMEVFALTCAIIGWGTWRSRLFALNPVTAAECILTTMSDALLLVGLDKKINLVNRSALEMLGYREDELIGTPVDRIFAEQPFGIAELFAKGSTFQGVIKPVIKGDTEVHFLCRDGKRIPVSLSGSLICDTEDNLVGIVCIARDITERQKTAQQLKHAYDELEQRVTERTAELQVANTKLKSEIDERHAAERLLAAEKERLAVTLRSIGEGVITTDTSGKIVLVNRAAERYTGFSSNEAIGQPLDAVLQLVERPDQPLALDPVDLVIHQGQLLERESDILLQTRQGSTVSINFGAAPVRANDGAIDGMVVVFRDITDKMKYENERLQTRKLESIGALAGGIAHDFNNTLTGIITNLFVAKMQVGASSETFELIAEAEKAAYKATALTKQLLTFSAEGITVKVKACIKDIIEDSIGFFLSGSSVEYKLVFDSNLALVEIDRGQVDSVLQSVIANAEEAMPDGGTITISVENVSIDGKGFFPLKPGDYVRVSVQDEGQGIPRGIIERIFDPFFTTKENSAGLGLSSAYAIVKKHNGYIDVSSEEGKGTTIAIYLPACPRESGAEPEQPKADSAAAKHKILLMDDEDLVRNAARKLLVRMGFDVVDCTNGTDALREYSLALEAGQRFDAVILDLTIAGGIGGKITISELQKLDPQVRAIVSSGYTNDPVLADYRAFGFSGMVAKPYTFEELSRTVQAVLRA
jgi:PAS domain S-box-containing protein